MSTTDARRAIHGPIRHGSSPPGAGRCTPEGVVSAFVVRAVERLSRRGRFWHRIWSTSE